MTCSRTSQSAAGWGRGLKTTSAELGIPERSINDLVQRAEAIEHA